MSNSDRRSIIRELRHQLYYSNPGPEREAIRRKLDFWLYYSNQTRWS
ncbi:hypothetical protein [Leptothermofonsia sp. ETS-13]